MPVKIFLSNSARGGHAKERELRMQAARMLSGKGSRLGSSLARAGVIPIFAGRSHANKLDEKAAPQDRSDVSFALTLISARLSMMRLQLASAQLTLSTAISGASNPPETVSRGRAGRPS